MTWREFCKASNLSINKCAKVVVVQNEEDLQGLEEFNKRVNANSVTLEWLHEDSFKKIAPNAKNI